MSDQDVNHPEERALALLLKPKVTPADREACARILLTECGGQLMRHIRRKTGLNEDDAEEALSDAVMQFIQTPPRRGTARPWLKLTAVSRGTDIYRRNHADKRGGDAAHVSLDAPDPDGPDDPAACGLQVHGTDNIEESYGFRRFLMLVAETFQVRAPTYVAALNLVALGYSEQEVADELGITKGAAKSKIHEVRELARKFFKE